tara:strand:+ start:2735 stop:3559 length:825 start_codon:yes stop_codon:yes gene_type:complete
MNYKHQIYLISDSTGETIDRIFLAIKAQFQDFEYEDHQYSFTRTENQILTILEMAKKHKKSIILYTIVDSELANFLENETRKLNIPCFGVLGKLIENFSQIIKQTATHIPSAQYALNDEYYKKIEAIQFTMNHDDGNSSEDIEESDIILLGVSRTSKTPTAIYLANRGFKTSNIPMVNENSVPKFLKKNPDKKCVVGLTLEPKRLTEVRKNRMNSLKENHSIDYTNEEKVELEILNAKKTFKKYQWPVVDVTRKSVEETAASIIKIYEIKRENG